MGFWDSLFPGTPHTIQEYRNLEIVIALNRGITIQVNRVFHAEAERVGLNDIFKKEVSIIEKEMRGVYELFASYLFGRLGGRIMAVIHQNSPPLPSPPMLVHKVEGFEIALTTFLSFSEYDSTHEALKKQPRSTWWKSASIASCFLAGDATIIDNNFRQNIAEHFVRLGYPDLSARLIGQKLVSKKDVLIDDACNDLEIFLSKLPTSSRESTMIEMMHDVGVTLKHINSNPMYDLFLAKIDDWNKDDWRSDRS